MPARVGTLAVGTRFITLLTGREGEIRAQREGETEVRLVGLGVPKVMHPDVVVRVTEGVH